MMHEDTVKVRNENVKVEVIPMLRARELHEAKKKPKEKKNTSHSRLKNSCTNLHTHCISLRLIIIISAETWKHHIPFSSNVHTHNIDYKNICTTGFNLTFYYDSKFRGMRGTTYVLRRSAN